MRSVEDIRSGAVYVLQGWSQGSQTGDNHEQVGFLKEVKTYVIFSAVDPFTPPFAQCEEAHMLDPV